MCEFLSAPVVCLFPVINFQNSLGRFSHLGREWSSRSWNPHDSPNVLEVHVVFSSIDLEADFAPSLPYMRCVVVSDRKRR
ncbi:hypothetical protein YC2023_009175 [Brassica napus]